MKLQILHMLIDTIFHCLIVKHELLKIDNVYMLLPLLQVF